MNNVVDLGIENNFKNFESEKKLAPPKKKIKKESLSEKKILLYDAFLKRMENDEIKKNSDLKNDEKIKKLEVDIQDMKETLDFLKNHFLSKDK